LSFLQPPPKGDDDNHGVRARTLGSILRCTEARAAVVTGSVGSATDLEAYARQLVPATPMTLVGLGASPAALRERLGLRAMGSGWRETGDDLPGMPSARLDQRCVEAVLEGERLERARFEDVVVETDARTPAEIASQVLAEAPGGWSKLLADG
jgi:hypothetical protein